MQFEQLPTGYMSRVEIDNGVVAVELKRLQESRDALTGILIVRMQLYGESYRLHVGKFNVMASRTRKELANYLKRISPKDAEIDWHTIIEAFSQNVIENHYATEPAVRIEPLEDAKVEFLLYPFIPKRHPALLYAPGGSGKSFLAMYLSLLVKNGIPFDLSHDVEPSEVLYLDWEVDELEARRRFGMLSKSFDVELEYPLYKRAVLTLTDELESVIETVVEYSVKLVIIDSAAPAVGGDINEASKVIQFFQNVRQLTTLGASVLILTHVSKAEKNTDEPTPVGSVFFENLSRLTWEIRYLSNEDGIIDFGLFPRKTNLGKFEPVGLRAVFKFNGVYFQELPADRLEMLSADSEEQLIMLILAKYPEGLTVKELADVTGFRRNTLARILSTLHERGLAELDTDGKWYAVDRVSWV